MTVSAREAMVRRYLPLARSLAWRYRHTHEPLDDLVQVASVGLIKAVDRWDPDRGLAFSTFAVPTILGELRRHFRQFAWMVRPPRPVQELVLGLERERDRARNELGREPTVQELAARLGRAPEEVGEALIASESRWTRSQQDLVPDDAAADDAGLVAAEARATVQQLTHALDPRTREILRLRFEEDLLQRQIAERVGCSQMHVSRLIQRALDQLEGYAAAA